jgi:hypothetical protein
MTRDATGADVEGSEGVTIGRGNSQQILHLDRNETAQYLSDANLKLEIQLGRFVDKLERIVDRLNEIERRLTAIELTSHHRNTDAQPLNWNIIILSALIAMLVGVAVVVLMVRL